MTQPTANEQLSAYLDGELTDTERGELEKALAEDPALRVELARLEKAVSFLKMHGPVQAPKGFQDRVLAKVASEPMPGWWWRWLRRPFGLPVEGLAVALAAAAVLLIALPFGLKTASQTGKDLASDPYGFVRSDEALKGRSEPAAAPVTAAPQEEEEEPAIADLDPDELGQDDAPADGLMASTSSKPAAPPPPPVVGGQSGDKSATREETETTANAAPTGTESSGYGDVQAVAAPNILLKYDVLTYDEDALVRLQRIAGKYRGTVTDASGASSKELTLQAGTTYLVEIPASALAAFGDDLHELGMVTESADPRKWAGDTVRVQVTFQVMPSPTGTRALKAAPTQTDEPASEEAN